MKVRNPLKNCDEHATTKQDVKFNPKEATNRPLRMLRMPDVVLRTGLSRSTIYAMMAANKFPRQIKVSENTAAWAEHEIEAYLIARIAARGEADHVLQGLA